MKKISMKPSSKNLHESIWQEKIQSGKITLTNRVREALNSTDSGYRCLDIGCGDGIFGELVRDKYQYVYGIDFSDLALKNALSKGVSAVMADIDGVFIPFRNNTFDLISCLDVIEHIFDPEKILRESYRILRKNGTLILTTPNIRFIDFTRSLLFDGRFPRTSHDNGGYDGGHIHYFTCKDIRSLLRRTGFQTIEERGYDEKKYISLKVILFKMIMRFWERDIQKEFFCPGILFKAIKI